MWIETWIVVLLTTSIICKTHHSKHHLKKYTNSELQHYWNLFKLRDVFVTALIKPETSGTIFKSEDEKQKLEISFDHAVLTITLPLENGWHKRFILTIPTEQNQTRPVDLTVVINENSILVFDVCIQIFSDQIPNMYFKLINPKLELLNKWNGELPKKLQIGSSFPINQKCDKIFSVAAKYSVEDIEKAYQPKAIDVLESGLFTIDDVINPPEDFDGCSVDGKLLKVGESWTSNCTTCTCFERDQVMCRVQDCPVINCANPIFRKDSCCPSCGSQCWFEDCQSKHPHGEIFWPEECYRCECWDSELSCHHVNVTCKTPQCPPKDWVIDSKYQCCSKCKDDASFCDMNPCHKYANCYNEKRGPKCVCKEGFYGNGTICMDVDECNFSEDAKVQLGGCMDGTTCKNTLGSFECHCLPGFQRLTEQVCIPLLRI